MAPSKTSEKMYVIKRGNEKFTYLNGCACIYHLICFQDGRKEDVYLDKITSRIQKLCYGLNMGFVDPVRIYLILILYTDDYEL